MQTSLIGEFLRNPSGWGKTADKRALFQVIDREELEPPTPQPSRLRRTLGRARRLPAK